MSTFQGVVSAEVLPGLYVIDDGFLFVDEVADGRVKGSRGFNNSHARLAFDWTLAEFADAEPGYHASNLPSAPFPVPTQLFRYGHATMWSTITMERGSGDDLQRWHAFRVACGQKEWSNGRALSPADTNLKIPGQVPSGINAKYDAAFWEILPAEHPGGPCLCKTCVDERAEARRKDIERVMAQGVLAFDMTQTSVGIGPLSAQHGVWNPTLGRGGVAFTQPVTLPGTQTFGVFLIAPPPLTCDLRLRIHLRGEYLNPIEIG